MADIDIQRKQGPGPWPWLIGLLALALIIWGVWEWMDTDEDMYVTTDTQEQVAPLEPASPTETPALPEQSEAQRFMAWVRDSGAAAQQMGREHEYTRAGLQRLSQALESLIVRDTAPAMQQHLQTVRQQVQEVEQSEATSTEHAAQVKQAFNAVVDAMEQLAQREHMQQAQLGEHVDAARSAADSLNEDSPLLEQRDAVHSFFRSMAQALEVAERHTAA